MRTLLTVMCAFTLLAVVYLSLSVLILQPPGVNYGQASLTAALFVTQSALTLLAMAGVVSGAWVRLLMFIGGTAITSIGFLAVRSTLSGPHFEGYALVLGSVLLGQGVLTIAFFLTGSGRSAPARTRPSDR